MIERMREVFFKSGLSQTEFARRVKVTPAYIWRILNIDTVKPSERVVADICREFNVSEDWLRTGEGAMTVPTDRDAEIAAFFGDVLRGEQVDFRRRFVAALAKLDDKGWALLEKMANVLIGEMQR